MEKIYRDLTGIDINEQKRIWDERGKGYYGEFLVMQKLYQEIPGTCKILMNLNVPAPYGRTTEIDLLMIHETGIYVFEIKHYKGTIYGKAQEEKWTQYFRTSPNHSFLNPVRQNEYHISALKKIFPEIPICSVVVFTSAECKLNVESSGPGSIICTLSNLIRNIRELNLKKQIIYTTEQINAAFEKLLEYAPERNTSTVYLGEVKPFYEYIDSIVNQFKSDTEKVKEEAKKSVEKAKEEAEKSVASAMEAAKRSIKKAKHGCMLWIFLVVAVCLAICVTITARCNDIIEQSNRKVGEAEKSMADFAKKFEHVDELTAGEFVFSSDLVTVDKVMLAESKELENAVDFSCELLCDSKNYKVQIGKDAVFNVILKDGSVKEYDFWNRKYPYYYDAELGTGKVAVHSFSDVELSDISYIKLTNLRVARLFAYPTEVLAEGYEIELYDSGK